MYAVVYIYGYLLLTVVYGAGNEGRHVEELGKCTAATGRILANSYALGDAARQIRQTVQKCAVF